MPVPAGNASQDLFSLAELESLLQIGPLNQNSALVARRIVSGWLRDATELAAWPDPIPDDLFGWAIELAGMVYDNPIGAASDTTGGTAVTYDRARRGQILEAARAAYADPARSGTAPIGSFPAADWSWTSTTPQLA